MLPPDPRLIERAAALLAAGELVAFPTETVYGLGADARRDAAVAKIFAAKGRPPNNPLIVHVASLDAARASASSWPPAAEALARALWPGPLTLVVPRAAGLAPAVSAGGDTVGLRVPAHPWAAALLAAFGGPVAAPSANRSNHVSPTTAAHVAAELGAAVAMVLDGGACAVGIESTVVDVSGVAPRILRPGGASRASIEAIVGPVEVATAVVSEAERAASPGQHAVHYAPRARALRFPYRDAASARARLAAEPGLAWGVVTVGAWAEPLASARVVALPGDAEAYARALYATLRALDDDGLDAIFIEAPPDAPAWLAVHDRLRRATRPA